MSRQFEVLMTNIAQGPTSPSFVVHAGFARYGWRQIDDKCLPTIGFFCRRRIAEDAETLQE